MKGHPSKVIERLQAEGLRVEVEHSRVSLKDNEADRAEREKREPKEFKWDDPTGSTDSPRGGMTSVQIFKGDDLLVERFATCGPYDRFEKNLGLRIALGRAIDTSIIRRFLSNPVKV